MKKNKIVIANWKMNKTVSESQKFISELINNRKLKNYENVVICPSFLSIMSILKKCLKNNIKLGAQNCFYEDIGSFTGEVSPIMLKKAGIEYVIIGHSERRIKLNETPDIINKKLFAALKNKLKVILCVGETKTEKDCGTEKSVILDQINSAVYDLQEIDSLNNLVIAYEPVWAIGNTNANVDP
ncbi:MAG: triose-phosphate isomerase, partial [Clostridia bacterium]|nr:triose-phosphate isomerase [Clostridia bacterium]